MREEHARQRDQHVQRTRGRKMCGTRKAVWPEGGHAVWEEGGWGQRPILEHLVVGIKEGQREP